MPVHLLDWSSSYIRFQEEVDIEMFSTDVLEAADGSSVANVVFVSSKRTQFKRTQFFLCWNATDAGGFYSV